MNGLRMAKKALLGDTWLLPLGVAVVLLLLGLVVRPLTGTAWDHLGGFVLLLAVLGLLTASVRRTGRPR